MDLGIDILFLFFLIAVLAGWVDAIAGGGGLITIPILMLAGVSPAAAVATNKLQGSMGTLTASVYFVRKGAVNFQEIKFLIVMTFVGSLLGAWLILRMNPEQLVFFIPALLILMGLYFLFSPHIDDQDRQQKLGQTGFALLVCPLLGFYDGFFGPGTGSFMALAFVVLCGYNLAKATAHAKILNFTSNFSSLVYFVMYGDIVWEVGLVMMLGQFIGAMSGAKMVLMKGASFIKPIVVTVCFIMSANILVRAYLL